MGHERVWKRSIDRLAGLGLGVVEPEPIRANLRDEVSTDLDPRKVASAQGTRGEECDHQPVAIARGPLESSASLWIVGRIINSAPRRNNVSDGTTRSLLSLTD